MLLPDIVTQWNSCKWNLLFLVLGPNVLTIPKIRTNAANSSFAHFGTATCKVILFDQPVSIQQHWNVLEILGRLMAVRQCQGYSFMFQGKTINLSAHKITHSEINCTSPLSIENNIEFEELRAIITADLNDYDIWFNVQRTRTGDYTWNSGQKVESNFFAGLFGEPFDIDICSNIQQCFAIKKRFSAYTFADHFLYDTCCDVTKYYFCIGPSNPTTTPQMTIQSQLGNPIIWPIEKTRERVVLGCYLNGTHSGSVSIMQFNWFLDGQLSFEESGTNTSGFNQLTLSNNGSFWQIEVTCTAVVHVAGNLMQSIPSEPNNVLFYSSTAISSDFSSLECNQTFSLYCDTNETNLNIIDSYVWRHRFTDLINVVHTSINYRTISRFQANNSGNYSCALLYKDSRGQSAFGNEIVLKLHISATQPHGYYVFVNVTAHFVSVALSCIPPDSCEQSIAFCAFDLIHNHTTTNFVTPSCNSSLIEMSYDEYFTTSTSMMCRTIDVHGKISISSHEIVFIGPTTDATSTDTVTITPPPVMTESSSLSSPTSSSLSASEIISSPPAMTQTSSSLFPSPFTGVTGKSDSISGPLTKPFLTSTHSVVYVGHPMVFICLTYRPDVQEHVILQHISNQTDPVVFYRGNDPRKVVSLTEASHDGNYTCVYSTTHGQTSPESLMVYVRVIQSDSQCHCTCPESVLNLSFLSTQELVKSEAAAMQRELEVDVTSLSATKRQKISSYDGRDSCGQIGTFAICLICVLLIIILVSDILHHVGGARAGRS